MTPTQKILLTGAIKSFVRGATGVIVALNVVDAEHFNFASVGGLKHLLFAVLIAGVVAEATYLNQWAHSGNGNSST